MIFFYPDGGDMGGATNATGSVGETTANQTAETNGVTTATSTATKPETTEIDRGTFTDPYEGIKYRSQLSKEVSDNKEVMDAIKDYQTVSDLASGYSKAKSDWANEKKGFEDRLSKAIEIPAKDAPKEEWETFMKKMDIPSKPEDYEFADPKDGILDFESPQYKAFKDTWTKRSMQMGLSKRQGRGMWATAVAMLNVEGKNLQANVKEAIDTFDKRQDAYLAKDYPVEADRKAQANEDKNNFAELVREADLGEIVKATGLALNPMFMHKMAEFYKATKAKASFGRTDKPEGQTGMFAHGSEWRQKFGK